MRLRGGHPPRVVEHRRPCGRRRRSTPGRPLSGRRRPSPDWLPHPLRLEEFFDGENAGDRTRPRGGDDIPSAPAPRWPAGRASWSISTSRDEIQFRSLCAGISPATWGPRSPNPEKMYKRFYFVDAVVLNRHKKGCCPASA